MHHDTLQNVLAVMTILSIGVPALWWLCACLIRGYKSFSVVSAIAAQFETNGGSSLKDRIESLHDLVDSIVTTNQVSMNLIAYPLLRADGGGQLDWVNKQFSHETGLSDAEASGLGWLSMVSEYDRPHVRSEWLSAIFDGRNIHIEFMLEDGRNATLEALPLVSKKRGVYGVVGTLRIESEFRYG